MSNKLKEEDIFIVDVSVFAHDMINFENFLKNNKEIRAMVPNSLLLFIDKDPSSFQSLLKSYNPKITGGSIDKLFANFQKYRQNIQFYTAPENEINTLLEKLSRNQMLTASIRQEFKELQNISPLHLRYYAEIMHAVEVGITKSPKKGLGLICLIPTPEILGEIRGTLGIVSRLGRTVIYSISTRIKGVVRNSVLRYTRKKRNFIKNFIKGEWKSYVKGEAVSFVIGIALSPQTAGVSTIVAPVGNTIIYLACNGYAKRRRLQKITIKFISGPDLTIHGTVIGSVGGGQLRVLNENYEVLEFYNCSQIKIEAIK